jgi:trimethylguanosine synthase
VEPTEAEPPETELQYWWSRRHLLFSRFDEGIQVDPDGLFALKPEHASLRMARSVPGRRVLDAFCGVGGTAIAFARAGKQVVTAELDGERLAMARHNARIYGVSDRITFLHEDALAVLARDRFDAIYLDPPWGGETAYTRPRFGLRDYVVDGFDLLERAFAAADTVVLSAPPNFDLEDVRSLDRPFRVETVELRGETLYLNLHFAPVSRGALLPAGSNGGNGRGDGAR